MIKNLIISLMKYVKAIYCLKNIFKYSVTYLEDLNTELTRIRSVLSVFTMFSDDTISRHG